MTAGDPIQPTPLTLAVNGIMPLIPPSGGVWEIKNIDCGGAYELHKTDGTWNGTSVTGATKDRVLKTGSVAEILMKLELQSTTYDWYYVKNVSAGSAVFNFDGWVIK